MCTKKPHLERQFFDEKDGPLNFSRRKIWSAKIIVAISILTKIFATKIFVLKVGVFDTTESIPGVYLVAKQYFLDINCIEPIFG